MVSAAYSVTFSLLVTCDKPSVVKWCPTDPKSIRLLTFFVLLDSRTTRADPFFWMLGRIIPLEGEFWRFCTSLLFYLAFLDFLAAT